MKPLVRVRWLLVAFGVVFELPVLVMFLSIAGVVTHRHLIKFARYFVVVAFVIAAVITPPAITAPTPVHSHGLDHSEARPGGADAASAAAGAAARSSATCSPKIFSSPASTSSETSTRNAFPSESIASAPSFIARTSVTGQSPCECESTFAMRCS